MCLIGIAIDVFPSHPFVLAANRDERHSRPSLAAGWWPDAPDVFGGRDLQAGGTWLAASRQGRVAAITNVHRPAAHVPARSRGQLVFEFVNGRTSSAQFARQAAATRGDYGPFNLVIYDRSSAYSVADTGAIMALEQGIHSISNAPVGIIWPKMRRLNDGIRDVAASPSPAYALLNLLRERAANSPFVDRQSDLFVLDDEYGTRCSTIVAISADSGVEFIERRYPPASMEYEEDCWRFSLSV